jgi:hypothetical protein
MVLSKWTNLKQREDIMKFTSGYQKKEAFHITYQNKNTQYKIFGTTT